ncbi:cell division protein FtsZ [Bordetella pertussis]|nr:cell division protein FtsZ [Bordetella pertussis]
MRALESSGMDHFDIPAFLRKHVVNQRAVLRL